MPRQHAARASFCRLMDLAGAATLGGEPSGQQLDSGGSREHQGGAGSCAAHSSAATLCGSKDAVDLCRHLCTLGFQAGAFSDVTVSAFGRQWPLHRVVLARSPYFRRLFEGDWKERRDPVVSLPLDDAYATAGGLDAALAWLYGSGTLALDTGNVCSVLACATYLQLDALGEACAAYITEHLAADTFSGFYAFAESSNYGLLGDRVRAACWCVLCRCAAKELAAVLPSLPLQTLVTLFTSVELWTPTEHDRFQLAFDTFSRRWDHTAQWALPDGGLEEGADAATAAVFGRGIVYATLSFQALSAARARLTAVGAPISILAAVSDGLWQQTVLRQQVTDASAGAPGSRPGSNGGGESGEEDAGSRVTLRFGTEFAEDLAQLEDGQARHGGETFFAGSLWKVSAQVFTQAATPVGGAQPDGGVMAGSPRSSPQAGGKTLGLFLHRRRADEAVPYSTLAGGGHLYVDCRDRVAARYQIVVGTPNVPLVLGTLAPENAILLPKAPKGWGWRSVGSVNDVATGHPLRVSVAVQLQLTETHAGGAAGAS
jgi:hypothetical protein